MSDYVMHSTPYEVWEHCTDDKMAEAVKSVMNIIGQGAERLDRENADHDILVNSDLPELIYATLAMFAKGQLDQNIGPSRDTMADYLGYELYGLAYGLPQRYDPDRHLDAVNSLMHIMHTKYPEVKELAVKEYSQMMWSYYDDASYSATIDITYIGDICLTGHDEVPAEWAEAVVDTASVYGCAVETRMSWFCSHLTLGEDYDYSLSEPVMIEIFADDRNALEMCVDSITRLQLLYDKETGLFTAENVPGTGRTEPVLEEEIR